MACTLALPPSELYPLTLPQSAMRERISVACPAPPPRTAKQFEMTQSMTVPYKIPPPRHSVILVPVPGLIGVEPLRNVKPFRYPVLSLFSNATQRTEADEPFMEIDSGVVGGTYPSMKVTRFPSSATMPTPATTETRLDAVSPFIGSITPSE